MRSDLMIIRTSFSYTKIIWPLIVMMVMIMLVSSRLPCCLYTSSWSVSIQRSLLFTLR